jgi:hypothetical protein
MLAGSPKKPLSRMQPLPAKATANPMIPKILIISSLESIFCTNAVRPATNNSFITKNLRFACKKNLGLHPRPTRNPRHRSL